MAVGVRECVVRVIYRRAKCSTVAIGSFGAGWATALAEVLDAEGCEVLVANGGGC